MMMMSTAPAARTGPHKPNRSHRSSASNAQRRQRRSSPPHRSSAPPPRLIRRGKRAPHIVGDPSPQPADEDAPHPLRPIFAHQRRIATIVSLATVAITSVAVVALFLHFYLTIALLGAAIAMGIYSLWALHAIDAEARVVLVALTTRIVATTTVGASVLFIVAIIIVRL